MTTAMSVCARQPHEHVINLVRRLMLLGRDYFQKYSFSNGFSSNQSMNP